MSDKPNSNQEPPRPPDAGYSLGNWSELQALIEQHEPRSWMLRFEPDGLLVLEHYPEMYFGDLEANCGDWMAEGSLAEVIYELRIFLK